MSGDCTECGKSFNGATDGLCMSCARKRVARLTQERMQNEELITYFVVLLRQIKLLSHKLQQPCAKIDNISISISVACSNAIEYIEQELAAIRAADGGE
jgi:hypothetical protein